MSPVTTARLARSVAYIAPAPVTLRLVSAPPLPRTSEPQWVERAWQGAKRELLRFLRTSWAFAAHPRESGRLWAEGRLDTLNPLAYLLNTVAVLGPWRALWQIFLHVQSPLWMEALWTLAPFLGVVLTSSFSHLLLSFAGGRRRITSTWAISIYATGGLVSAFQLIATPFLVLSDHIKTSQDWHDHWLAYVLGQSLVCPELVWQTLAMAGLHGLRARRVLVTQVFGMLALGVLLVFASIEVFILAMTLTHHRL